MVVIASIAVGSWAVIFMSSFSNGLVLSYIDNAIQNEISHLQFHNPEFLKDKEIEFTLDDADVLLQNLKADERVAAASVRTLSNAMLASAKVARGILVKGIDAKDEAALTGLDKLVVEGNYLNDKKKNAILVSRKIAEKLQVKIRSKVVLTFQDFESEIVAGAFRVIGIFETSNMGFDQANCFIRRKDMNKLLGTPIKVNAAPLLTDEPSGMEPPNTGHEIAVYLKNHEDIAQITAAFQKKYPSLKVRNYKEISPDVELMESQIEISSIIFMTIVMLALVFGIINTMLMAVLERYKELGVLMAIGMSKGKVFAMIVLETLMLALFAAPIGLAIGYLSVKFFEEKGIDLSAFSAGMREFGMSEIVYPNIESTLYVQLTIAVAITALLASLYPAWKAVRLKPIEAIRKL